MLTFSLLVLVLKKIFDWIISTEQRTS